MSEEQIKSTEELNQTPVEAIETNPAKFDATVFMGSLKSMKPASIKGQYIKSIFYFYYHGSNHRCRKYLQLIPCLIKQKSLYIPLL
ncbi:MAG: hypothetical protein HXL10_01395 [Candidatus Nanosynbacter sp.]|nr:hypothetical protein [Candidatus Nanosynbacter sp.]